jgi:hypothetical protein
MHREFQPADAPDPADPDVEFGIAPEQITSGLLELCEQFFRQGSPIVLHRAAPVSRRARSPWRSRLVHRRPWLHKPQPRRHSEQHWRPLTMSSGQASGLSILTPRIKRHGGANFPRHSGADLP